MTTSSQSDNDVLEEVKECLADNWFVDNPNGSDVNGLIQKLVAELENERGCLDKLTDAYGAATGLLAECLYFGSMDANQMEDLTKRIEGVLDGK